MKEIFLLSRTRITNSSKAYYTEAMLDSWTTSLTTAMEFPTYEAAQEKLSEVVEGINYYKIEKYTRKSIYSDRPPKVKTDPNVNNQ